MRVYVDSRDLALAEYGDAIAAGQIYAELEEVVNGAKPDRESAEAVTLFKSGGLAVEDVATADLIHRKASDTTTAENAFGDLEHQSNHQSGDDLVIQEVRFDTDILPGCGLHYCHSTLGIFSLSRVRNRSTCFTDLEDCVDKIPGKKLVEKAEETGNEVPVPMTRRRLGLVELLKRTAKEIQEDHLAAFAGNLTYKGLFALFPFFVFLLSLLGLFGAPDLLENLVDRASGVLPQAAVNFLEDQVVGIVGEKAQGAFTVGAVVSILLALWGVSGAFRSVMEAMNVMYEIEEARPFWKQALISIFLSLGIAVLLIFALVLVVFGPEIGGAIADVVGLGYVFEVTWNVVQWPVLLFLVVLAFALVYYYAPDVEQRFRWISPGSIVAVVAWLLFSLSFSLYVEFGSFDAYGSIAGIIILMLYIYYSSFIMLIGAQLNQVIEEHIPEGKNEGEKTLDPEQ